MNGQLKDWEVSLIKGMLRRAKSGALNKQDILSYFSVPERSINPARIEEIQGNDHRYSGTPEASFTTVMAFMKDYPNQTLRDYLKEWGERLGH